MTHPSKSLAAEPAALTFVTGYLIDNQAQQN
jgi:hypothetical protein